VTPEGHQLRPGGGIHLLGGECGLASKRAREAGAEETVKHDVVGGQAHVFERLARPCQRVEGVYALGRAIGFWREIVEPDIAAEIAQTLGRHEGIAAIVAGAGEHDDASFREFGVQDVSAGLPCLQHQSPQRDASLDGALLCGADFVTGEDGEGHVRSRWLQLQDRVRRPQACHPGDQAW
jgi:hypothetical protein